MKAGVNDPDDSTIAVLQYLPAKVTVEAGSEVTWQWDRTTEPHSVTFLAAGQTLPDPESDPALSAPTPATGPIDGQTFVNSGLLPLGPDPVQPMQLQFDTPGTYSYICVIHPQMVGEVEVVASGGDTAADVIERATSEQDQWLAEGRAAKKAFEASPAATTNKDGTKTYQISMGTSTAHSEILAFAPPGGSPQVLVATGFFNTGLLPPNAPPGAGPPEAVRSFVFTVPKAGTFPYVCLLHASSGMTGTINAA